MNEDDELLDLVDKDDNVIGTINRTDYQRMVDENLGYIRAAQLFLVNSKGQIYTPTRTADKTIVPNGLDYSAGGHVGAGDSYVQAMVRELKEELNLDAMEQQLELVAKVLEDKILFHNSIYMIRTDETPTFNPHDFVSAEWLMPEELIAKIDGGHPAKDSLRHAVQLLQEHLSQA